MNTSVLTIGLVGISIAWPVRTSACQSLEYKQLVETRRAPARIVEQAAGHYFVDFGKAAFGTIEVTLTAVRAGEVEVHFGEKLAGENTIDREPPGTIRYRRTRIETRPETHRYRVEVPPDKRNTTPPAVRMPDEIGEVLPFRYCELVGDSLSLSRDAIRQIMVHYPFDDTASCFQSSDPVLNSVWDLCKYSIKATTFCGIYVDGDRERIAYEGDAYLNQLSHYCVDREYGLARQTQKHFMHYPTWPTEWLLHSPLMAHAEYQYTGDISFARDHYDDLKLRTLLELAREDGLISTRTGLVTAELCAALNTERIRDLVDWPPAGFTRDGKYGERDGYEMVDINTVVNAFHYRSLVVMAELAEVLGKHSDATMFADRARQVHRSFNQVFWNDERHVYVDGEGSRHASLHANMFPLALGLVPAERQASVVQFIQSRGMACSVYGAQYLLEALYQAGADDYALELMTATHDRGWWNMIQVGSTITLEAWDWKYKTNLDWNHAWGAVPANIIPRFVMGIRPLKPGFEKILIQPQPGFLEHAGMKMPTLRGTVRVRFENETDGMFRLHVHLPPDTTARVEVPRGGSIGSTLMVNDQPRDGEFRGDFLAVELDAGEWEVIRGTR